MSDSVVYKGAPPPPPTAKVRAQRRRRRRLIFFALAVIALGAGVWQVVAYMNSARQRAEALVAQGQAYLTPGRYEESLRYFDEALAVYGRSAAAYYHRGIARLNLGQQTEAAADLRAALDLDSSLVAASVALAEIQNRSGNRDRGIAELTRIINSTPTVDAYYQRASAYAELGEHQKAIDDFTWIIEQVRDAPFIYLGRSKSRRALGDLEGARQDEETAATFDRAPELRGQQ